MASTTRDSTKPAGAPTDLNADTPAMTDTLFGRINELNASVGAGNDTATGDGVVGSVHSKLRTLYTAIITTIGGAISTLSGHVGASDDAQGATEATAGETIFARLRFWFNVRIGKSDDAASASLVDAAQSLFGRLRYAFQILFTLGKREMLRFGNATVTRTNTSNWLTPDFNGMAAPNTNAPGQIVTQPGVLSRLYVRMSSDADQNAIFTVQVNGADTALTCTLLGAGSVYAGSDEAHTVNVAAGDVIAIKCGLAVAPSSDLNSVMAAVQFDAT